MNKKLILLVALLSGISVVAMEEIKETPVLQEASHHEEEAQVKIRLINAQNTETPHEVTIPVRLAKLIGVLKDLLDDPELLQAGFPVYVSVEDWHIIERHLEHLYSITHDEAQTVQLRQEIIMEYAKLPNARLIELIHTLDYVGIPSLLELACSAVSILGVYNTGTFEQMSSLPGDLGNRLILQELLKTVGPAQGKKIGECTVPGSASCIITEDGLIVSGFLDGTLSVCDSEGKEQVSWKGHTALVTSLCVTNKGEIVSGSVDGTVCVWNMHGNKRAVCSGHEDRVQAVCVTNDRKIVSGSHDKTVRVWDMDGTQRKVFKGEEQINALCVTGDNRIIIGTVEKTVRVLDSEGRLLTVCRGHQAPIWVVGVTQDDKILSGSCDGTMRRWDREGHELTVYKHHEGWVRSLCEMKDGSLVSGGKGCVWVWERSGTARLVIFGQPRMIRNVYVASNGSLTTFSENHVVTWDIALLQNMVRMDELHAKVVWEYFKKLKGDLKSIERVSFWGTIEEIMNERDLETNLRYWIEKLKLDPAAFG